MTKWETLGIPWKQWAVAAWVIYYDVPYDFARLTKEERDAISDVLSGPIWPAMVQNKVFIQQAFKKLYDDNRAYADKRLSGQDYIDLLSSSW